MRKINSRDFRVATRSTSREINRRIALTVIHEHQPISRAELARRMKVTRGVAGVLVQELIDQGHSLFIGKFLNSEASYEDGEVGDRAQYAEKHLEPPLISSNY